MSSFRRKSKLTLLNNEYVNEMPIIVLNEISLNSTENMIKTPDKGKKNSLKDQVTTIKNSDFDSDMYSLIKQKYSKADESPMARKFKKVSLNSASKETNPKESKSKHSKEPDDSNILKENILLQSPSKRKTAESDFDVNLRTPTKKGKINRKNEEVIKESPVHRKFNRLSLQSKCDTSHTSIEDVSIKQVVKKKLDSEYKEITPERKNSNIFKNEFSPSKCSPNKEVQNTDLIEKPKSSECKISNKIKKITKCDNSDLKESEDSAEENDTLTTNVRSLRKKNETDSSQKNTPSKNLRRSTRMKRMSIKAMEAKGVSPSIETDQSLMSTDESAEECEQDANVKEKPSTLFEDKDVAGRLLFGFQTPKKRDGLTKKAIESTGSPRTPKSSKIKKVIEASQTPKTPIGKLIVPLKNLRTPQAVRSQIKIKLNKASQKAMQESDSEFSDYSEESDFKPSDSSSSDESDSSKTESDSDSDTQRTARYPDRKIQIKKNVANTKLIQSSYKLRQRRDLTYTLKFEDYFASHGGSKSLTSNHTLQRLKNPKLQQDRLNKLLSSMVISKQHENSINTLFKEHKSIFDKWLCILHEGFSILLYGLGSKYSLIQSFHKAYLSNSPVIVINGFFPSLLIKDILDGIIDDLLELPDNPTNIFDAVDLIDKEFSEMPELHLFLIIHNIDGDMLRNNKCQNVLSRLAKIQNIHLIASIDHINAPLIWDHKKLSRFNFTWWDATTFLPYKDETSFESSLLVQQSGALTLSSLRNVFRSLTTNARGIYNIIMKNQLENKGNQHYQGMQFKDLYRACREAFLVSSDLALRAQLTEFLDHKLVKSRRNIDGAELLNIPIENNLLKHFMDEQN